MNWELLSGISSSLKFRDAVCDCCLVQLVHTPTRGHSILDLVLTNDPSIFSEVNVIEPLLGSDHRAVACRLSFSVSCPSPQIDRSRSFDYRLANWDLYADIVQKVNWDDMFSLHDSNAMWNFLKNALFDAAKVAIPLSRPVRKFRGVKVSGEVKSALNARRKLYKRYRDCHADFVSDKSKAVDGRLEAALRESGRRTEQNIVARLITAARLFWKHIRNGLGNKPNIVPVVTADGSFTSSDVEIAEEFNKFFASVFVREQGFSPKSCPLSASLIDSVVFNDHQVYSIL